MRRRKNFFCRRIKLIVFYFLVKNSSIDIIPFDKSRNLSLYSSTV